jgi:hypothetical protein
MKITKVLAHRPGYTHGHLREDGVNALAVACS